MSRTSTQYSLVLGSPLGKLGIVCADDSVTRLDYLSASAKLRTATSRFERQLVRELQCFFADPNSRFSLPVALTGTEFQRHVWLALQSIPPAEVRTYGQLAAQLGSGPRAVGNACRRNPVSIIVPCHRVVSAAGLGGYSGKTGDRAIWRKHWLLRHEGADCAGLKTCPVAPTMRAGQNIQRIQHV